MEIKRSVSKEITSSPTTVIEVPDGKVLELQSLFIYNESGASVDVIIYDGDTTTDPILKFQVGGSSLKYDKNSFYGLTFSDKVTIEVSGTPVFVVMGFQEY